MDVGTTPTSSFYKKYDEIYYDNHTHTKNITIDCVNHDCLAEIFMYVPACERPKVALVCEKWQKALNDSWFDAKKLELIHWEFHEHSKCLTNYPTIDRELSFIKSLLDKCGRFLTKLDLTAYGHCNIVPVVNDRCPNLIRLRLRFTSIDNEMLLNAFTRLSKLKSLTIIFQNIKTNLISDTLINSLKNVAKTLTQLDILNWAADDLSDYPDVTEAIDNVVRYLKKLKILELAGVRISWNLLDYLENEKIEYFNHTVHIENTLSLSKPLMNITSLKILECPVKDETLYSMANTFKNLEVLHVNVTGITDYGVVALTKINLDYLNLKGFTNMITDSSVKLFKNLERLVLPVSRKITDVSIMKVLENSPMISVLSVYGCNVTAELVKEAAEISKNRQRHLLFCVELMPNIQQYESTYFEIYRLHLQNGEIVLYDDITTDDITTDADCVFTTTLEEQALSMNEFSNWALLPGFTN